MKSKWLAVAAATLLVAAAPGWTASDKAKGGGQGAQKKAKTPKTEQVEEETAAAESRVPETLRHRDRAQTGQDTADRDWDKERERREGRDGDADRDRDRDADRDRDRDSDERTASRGSETSQEMQRRKEERKEIKGDYKEARKAGEVEASGKKPWWKFWEGEEPEAAPTEN